MGNKRYAIVRVDNTWCPNKFENIDNRFVCDSRRKHIKRVHCERCNYGDTKKQMIMKVAQALELCMKKGYRTITSEEYAKEIVEFLGVK